MRIQSLIAAFAAIPALWLAVSFIAPATTTAAYVPPASAFQPVIAAAQPIGVGAVLAGIEETP